MLRLLDESKKAHAMGDVWFRIADGEAWELQLRKQDFLHQQCKYTLFFNHHQANSSLSVLGFRI